MIKFKYFIPILLTLMFLGSYQLVKTIKLPTFKVSKQQSAINFKDEFLLVFNLGYKRLISDLIWINSLIASDLEHYHKKDLNSWLYLKFNSISILDPKFIELYQFATPYLSVVKDDILGSNVIGNKGLSYYPNNEVLNFQLGYNYQYELADPKSAYPFFKKLEHLERYKYFIPTLLARHDAVSGNLKEAFLVIHTLYENNQHIAHMKKKLAKILYSLKAEMDLDCLNNNENNCSRVDFDGNKYLVDASGKYFAQKKWNPYRYNKKAKKRPTKY